MTINQIIDRTFTKNSSDKLLSSNLLEEIIDNNYYSIGLTYRQMYAQYSWCILTDDLLTTMKELTNNLSVIEVMAGTGWLFFWMKRYGINVIKSTDDFSWKNYNKCFMSSCEFTSVKNERAIDTIANTKADVVVMSWPPYNTLGAQLVWEEMKPKQYLIYIGEGEGGCNANDKFFDYIKPNIKKKYSILSWPNIYDYLYFIQKPK